MIVSVKKGVAKDKGIEESAWTGIAVQGLQHLESSLTVADGAADLRRSTTTGRSTTHEGLKHTDSMKMMSADLGAGGDCDDSEHDELSLPPSYPLPLVLFVGILAIISGFVVMAVHSAVKYAGCPLGLNGCNSFLGYEHKGFFFIRWVKDWSNGSVPEDVVYIFASLVAALIFTELWKRLPEDLAFQLKGGGTVQALVAVAGGQRITIAAAILRLIVSSLYLGLSGTLGMDGPAIQICTSVTSGLGWLLGMRGMATQSLLACLGFAGGFSASFNSPLAGIMFAMEELQHVSHSVSRHIICVILMMSIVACAVVRLVQGDQSLFDAQWDREGGLPQVLGRNLWMLVCVPISVVASLWGYAISKVLNRTWTLIDFMKKHGVPYRCIIILMTVISAAIGSIVFRITGLRGVWGIGYESLQKSFDSDISGSHFIVFSIGKSLAMVVSVAVFLPGDMLEPVLISGGFLGGGIGCFLEFLIQDPDLASAVVKPCIVFGMVSLFASCFRFPLTPVVMVLEFMGEETYAIVLPTALAAFTAITVSNRLFHPLLDSVMHRDHISLEIIRDESEAASERESEIEEASDHDDGTGSSCPSESTHSSRASFGTGLSALVHGSGAGLQNSMLSLAQRSPSRSNSDKSHSTGARSHRHRAPRLSHTSGASHSDGPSRNSSRAGTGHSQATSGTIITSLGFHSERLSTLNIPAEHTDLFTPGSSRTPSKHHQGPLERRLSRDHGSSALGAGSDAQELHAQVVAAVLASHGHVSSPNQSPRPSILGGRALPGKQSCNVSSHDGSDEDVSNISRRSSLAEPTSPLPLPSPETRRAFVDFRNQTTPERYDSPRLDPAIVNEAGRISDGQSDTRRYTPSAIIEPAPLSIGIPPATSALDRQDVAGKSTESSNEADV